MAMLPACHQRKGRWGSLCRCYVDRRRSGWHHRASDAEPPPRGIILIGEPYWRKLPSTEDVAKGCLANSISKFHRLPELLSSFGHVGYDVVEMVLADQDSWDRYEVDKDFKWLSSVRHIHQKSRGTYGSRQMSKELRGRGYGVGRSRAGSLMKKPVWK